MQLSLFASSVWWSLKHGADSAFGNEYTELGELLDVRVGFLLAIGLYVVVCAKVSKDTSVLDGESCYEHKVSHSHCRTVITPMRNLS